MTETPEAAAERQRQTLVLMALICLIEEVNDAGWFDFRRGDIDSAKNKLLNIGYDQGTDSFRLSVVDKGDEITMTTVQRFRRRPVELIEVSAQRWDDRDNPPSTVTKSQVVSDIGWFETLGDDGDVESLVIRFGQWLIQRGDGRFEAVDDDEFTLLFEPAE